MADDAPFPPVQVRSQVTTRQTTAVLVISVMTFSGVLLAIAALSPPLRWPTLLLGMIAAVVGLAAFCYAFFLRPSMLRSDEQMIVESILAFAREEDVDDRKLVAVQRLLASPKATRGDQGDQE